MTMILQAYTNFMLLEELYVQQMEVRYFVLDFKLEYCFDLTSLSNAIWELSAPYSGITNSKPLQPELIDNLRSGTVGIESLQTSLIEQPTNQLQNLQTIYHYSIPTVKLFYPEPFIAAPSFMHTDLWFIHILVYQYWLWFVFIFIIVFFIITFLCIVRWCNMRVRPRRETRGVSRSKCGDLITAIVPVSWAASIIISESTDAIDYFDGFGTTEMVVGIRAYQWGWEYYYPKDIDLNYNVKKSHSAFFGRSLKYNRTAPLNLSSNKAWKFYQNKPYDSVVTPAHLLLLPTDNYKTLNYLNFSDVGTNAFHDSALFKHTRMFSKTWNTNLININSDFSSKFQTLSPLFSSDFDLHDSSLYGLKRQQNFITTKAVTNNFSTLFNLKSVTKLFSQNYNLAIGVNHTFLGKHQINFFKPSSLNKLTSAWLFNQTQTNMHLNGISFALTKKFIYANLLEKLNNDSDKKKLKNSLKKLLSNSPKKTTLLDKNLFTSNSSFDNTLTAPSPFVNRFFDNTKFTRKFFVSFSANFYVQKPGQTPKEYINVSPRKGSPNLDSRLNAPTFYSDKTKNSLVFSPTLMRAASKLKSSDPQTLYKLVTNRIYFDSPTPAILSNKKNNPLINFDKYLPAEAPEDETAYVYFQSRDDIAPEYIYRAFWNTHGNQTDLSWRLKNSSNFNKIHNAFYLPFFTFGQDYDFLNWQGLIYLEDAYWENLASVYALDDYLLFFDLFDDYTSAPKLERNFWRKIRKLIPEDFTVTEPYLDDIFMTSPSYGVSVHTEETMLDPTLLPTWQFSTFPTSTNVFLMEDSFDYSKASQHLYHYNLFSSIGFITNNLPFNNGNFVVDNFRSNAEDFTWYNNVKLIGSSLLEKNMQNLPNELFLLLHWNVESFNTFLPRVIYNYNLFNYTHDSAVINPFVIYNAHKIQSMAFDFNKTLRMHSKFDFRIPARAAVNMYNSYQRVYKPRLDENRSHARTTDIANLSSKQPNLTAPKVKLERSFGKNKTPFFQTSTFKNELPLSFNILYDSFNSLNYYFFDFPFLMGLKSDVSRYYWTDWFARWGMFEVQPASSARSMITGVPFFNKSFDFSGSINSDLYDLEGYFTRISRARKNYLPNWAHVPYVYSKNTFFSTNNFFFDAYKQKSKRLLALKNILGLSHWFWQDITIDALRSETFVSTQSNIHTYARSSWVSNSPISAYYTVLSLLLDSLTKREYLYREFLSSKKKIYRLETYMTNSPTNPILKDVKAAFFFANPTTFNVEYSREAYYSSLEFFNINYVKPNFIALLKTLGVPATLAEAALNLNKKIPAISTLTAPEHLKSQYRPMRKGITNMIRLHGTGAVAMPIEIRLQVLASSKDVIHSWAIPSAGVKIDCVPGYSSHRVIIFLVSGIFWGQCMEVCGRYHHWMPVIVYFMKRDLFFLWCTHFVFLSGSNNMWVINDRQNTNYGRTVSFSKSSWVNELK